MSEKRLCIGNRFQIDKKLKTTSDKEIVRLRWIYVDFDPIRLSGISSNDDEKFNSYDVLNQVSEYLKTHNFPDPIIADSGNGYHLIYSIDLSPSESDLIKNFLSAINSKFQSNGTADIDTQVFNPSRITKLYGTVARKGADTAERPHRTSGIINIPERIDCVTREQLQSVIDDNSNAVGDTETLIQQTIRPATSKSKSTDKIDTNALIDRLLRDNNIGVVSDAILPDGRRKIALRNCLFDPNHTNNDAAIFVFPNGGIHYKCFHNSCNKYGWKDARKLLDPNYAPNRYTHRKETNYPKDENGKPELFEYARDSSGNKKGSGLFRHDWLGNYLIEKHGVCIIPANGNRRKDDPLLIYDDTEGILTADTDAIAGYMIEEIPNISLSKRHETYEYLKGFRQTPIKELAPPNLIPFHSQVYDVENDRFLDYNNDLCFLNRFPFDYDPYTPDEPLILETIFRICDKDKQLVNLLFECLGYLFYRENKFRGAMFLYGNSGNNGKSTVLNIVRRFVGECNTSFLSLKDTEERFRLISIFGKLLNVGDDISKTTIDDSSVFKRLVTGEEVIAERKGVDAVSFRSYAKLWFAMNDKPIIRDTSGGLSSRIIMFPLNHDFSRDGTMNYNLKERKWSRSEIECLYKYAMNGLRNLLNDGRFSIPDKVAEANNEYRIDNNPVLAWLIEEYGDPLNIDGVETGAAFRLYKEYCSENNYQSMGSRTFLKAVANALLPNRIITKNCSGNVRRFSIERMENAKFEEMPDIGEDNPFI